MAKFRNLRADEIDVRIGTISDKGCSLLLYKDARCDMNILDETVGPENWQRSHLRDNANCVVSIYDSEKKTWVSKEDVGTKSYSEPEKGLASDSFKRACINWGIGRELYTSPFIWVSADDFAVEKNKDGKITTKDKFKVESIEVTEGVITKLDIVNTGRYEDKKDIVFTYPRREKAKPMNTPKQELEDVLDKPKPKTIDQAAINTLISKLRDYNFACGKQETEASMAGYCKCKNFAELDYNDFKRLMNRMDKRIDEVKAQIYETDRQNS